MLNHIIKPIFPEDVAPSAAFRTAASSRKGVSLGPEARPIFDAMRGATPVASGVRIERGVLGGVPGHWCRVASEATDARLLFLHGGGYVLGSSTAMTGFASQLAARCGADTFIADYRLAPEAGFPAAFDDALSAYVGLASTATGPVAVAGESAGGGLTLALLGALGSRSDLAMPVAAAVMSPWTDLTLRGDSYRTRADADPIFTHGALDALATMYLQGSDPADPRASPLFAVPAELPPLRIDVGEDEVLLNDATLYAERAAANGAAVTLTVWQGMPHVFQARVAELAAARESFDEAGEFLRAALAQV